MFYPKILLLFFLATAQSASCKCTGLKGPDEPEVDTATIDELTAPGPPDFVKENQDQDENYGTYKDSDATSTTTEEPSHYETPGLQGTVQPAPPLTEVNSTITLRWLNANTMQILWPSPKNKQELIFLTPMENFPGANDPCVFTGKLECHLDGSAAVVGCIDDHETIVNIGISDEGVKELVIRDGVTLEQVPAVPSKPIHDGPPLTHVFKTPEKPTNLRFRRAADFEESGGYLWPDEEPPKVAASRRGKPPKEITLKMQLSYDQTFSQHFRGSYSNIKSFINRVTALAKPHFLSSTLVSKINLKIDPNLPGWNFRTKADNLCNGRPTSELKNFMRQRKGNDVAVTIFTEDIIRGGRATTGCAYVGTACGTSNGENLAIVDLSFQNSESRQLQQVAKTFVHETGHLLGMQHDFDHPASKGCNYQGFMSYDKVPERWSQCSNEDFTNWFNKKGFTCLEYGETNCGGHMASSCRSCGDSYQMCNGECTWNSGQQECVLKETGYTLRDSYGWHDENDGISNLKTVTGASTYHCETACTATAQCVGFTFVKRAGRCDLKSDKQAVKLSRTYAEVASGTLKLRQGAGWHNEKGSISTLKIVSAEKASQCEEPCRQTRGCVGWTYVRGPKRCDLKSKEDAASYSFIYKDVVSGLI